MEQMPEFNEQMVFDLRDFFCDSVADTLDQNIPARRMPVSKHSEKNEGDGASVPVVQTLLPMERISSLS